MLNYHTAGDSHGEELLGILEGFPAHVSLSVSEINRMLARRQGGYGRSKRQQIEQDTVRLVSGLWRGESTGAPIGLLLANRASKAQDTVRPRTIPRPGHADLAGAWKYGWENDLNPVIERSSARETAMRTAIGAICQALLRELQIEVLGYVRRIGDVAAAAPQLPLQDLRAIVERSPFYCADPAAESAMRERVDTIREQGDSLGGVVEVIAGSVPPGLGGFQDPELRLDAQLAQVLMSIPSVKAVEIGDGIAASQLCGSEVHDEILLTDGRLSRQTNRAGGIEGGVSNGAPLVVRIYLKPIPTLMRGIGSVDLSSGQPIEAPYIRSDVVVVPAAAVVAEAMVAFVLARAILEKFGNDHLDDIKQNLKSYLQRLRYY